MDHPDPVPEPGQPGRGAVGRAVVDHDHLVVIGEVAQHGQLIGAQLVRKERHDQVLSIHQRHRAMAKLHEVIGFGNRQRHLLDLHGSLGGQAVERPRGEISDALDRLVGPDALRDGMRATDQVVRQGRELPKLAQERLVAGH